MAKRKRLTPRSFAGDDKFSPELETKSFRGAPPISGIVHDAASTAALEEMSQALRSARESGRMVLELPLDQIRMDYLVRDRVVSDPEELDALVGSLRARGQQQPIEVVALGGDTYGLISGWRRCQAIQQIAAEEGGKGMVLALLRNPKESSDAYLAMVEENEIRVGLSYYERARIVLRAVEQDVFDSDKSALQSLFQSASRAKRSKIGSFLHIVRALDGALRFPASLAERAGLVLARQLEDDPALASKLIAALKVTPPETAEAERALLDAALGEVTPAEADAPAPPRAANPAQKHPPVADRPPLPAAKPGAAPSHPTPRQVAAAVWMQDNADGSITLSGAGLTRSRRDSLLQWIAVNL